MNEPTYLLIEVRLRDSLISYLAGKPWAEVHEGIAALRSLPPAPPPPEPVED